MKTRLDNCIITCSHYRLYCHQPITQRDTDACCFQQVRHEPWLVNPWFVAEQLGNDLYELRFRVTKQLTPNLLGFQLANTWPKITAHDVYAMIRDGKECKNS